MEIKYFRLIKAIEEEGNLANSAEKLYVTQSALSHQLKELETRLGFKVFNRSRNQWNLTEEGKELYELGNTILGSIEKSFKNIEQLRTGSSGTIKVSTECYSFYHGLSSFIQKMGLMYPDIRIDLILEATHQPISKILSKEIDIAIVTSKPEDKNLLSVAIYDDEIFAILHQENPLNNHEVLLAEAFKEVHLIIHSYPLDTVSVYQKFLQPNKIEPTKISAIPLTEVALEMVEANVGVMCMPKWALKSFRLSENLSFKRLGEQGLKRKHYLVFRKKDMSKKYINDFIVNLQEDFLK